MEANSDWVFVKRDETEKKHLGLDISEKALTKNLKGIVVYSRNKEYVNKRVHIPHYNVIDWGEYAIFREKDMFAIEGEDGYVPVNRFVHIRKCENEHILDDNGDVLLYRTDNDIEKTNWVEIIAVAGDCRHVEQSDIGGFCIAPERSENLRRLSYSKDFMLHEDEIQFITSGE